jgi:hypothetical protein
MLVHRPEIVAYMQPTRRLNARKYSQNKSPYEEKHRTTAELKVAFLCPNVKRFARFCRTRGPAKFGIPTVKNEQFAGNHPSYKNYVQEELFAKSKK